MRVAERRAAVIDADAEMVEANAVLVEPILHGRHRPQAHQHAAAAKDDPTEEDLVDLGGRGVPRGGDSAATSSPRRLRSVTVSRRW